MAKQIINVGNIVNDGAGDTLRAGATKINSNFTEVYSKLGNGAEIQLSLDFTTSPIDGQTLQYVAATNKFVPGEAGARGIQGIQGPVGPEGPQGPIGPEGPQGIQGEIGPRLTVQGSVTSNLDLPATNNEVGDIYVTISTGDSYVWVQSPVGDSSYSWENIGPLRGPQGLTGATGPQGPMGPQGPAGERGLQGPAGSNLGPFFGDLTGSVYASTSTRVIDGDNSFINTPDITITQLLHLPAYTVAQTAGISGQTVGATIYVSNGNSGNPCLAVWNGVAWARVVFGAPISI